MSTQETTDYDVIGQEVGSDGEVQVEIREEDGTISVVNLVINESDDSIDAEGEALIAEMPADTFTDVADTLQAAIDGDLESADAPSGDGWTVGRHPLFGHIVFVQDHDDDAPQKHAAFEDPQDIIDAAAEL